MTHTFKLARRMARLKRDRKGSRTQRSGHPFFRCLNRPAHMLGAALLVAIATGCTDNKLSDITSASQPESDPDLLRGGGGKPGKQIISLIVSPDTVALAPQQSKQFSAKALRSDSTLTSVAVVWSATGGTIDSTGYYTATDTAGAFSVIAKQGSGAIADTARVTVTSAPSSGQAVVLTPDSITLTAGATQAFSAAVKLSDGTTSSQPVTYKATGGTIDSAGAYTAPDGPGTYKVIATLSASGPADTSNVTVLSATPATVILPGASIQAAVNAFPGGTRFTLKAGIHRMQKVTPKSGDVFAGEPGAILSGARQLTSFTRSGSYWVAGGQTQQGATAGQCEPGYEACIYPEDLFINNVVLRRVTSLGSVAPGTWYFDYAADKVYLMDDPTAKTVEIGVTPYAFTGSGVSNVTIQGLVIEKYASPASQGALQGGGSIGWVVQDNEVRWNHGMGIRLGSGTRVLRNNVHHNGQLGLGGGAVDDLVEGNEIAYNNALHFDRYWEAGGTKFVRTQRLVVRGNHVHHNRGHGLWTDIDNISTTYENNTCEDNTNDGIFHEISYDAVIRYNTARRNGTDAGWMDGAGISVSSSPNVEIYGNTVAANRNGIAIVQYARGSGAYGEHLAKNIYVHDNNVTMSRGVTGVAQAGGGTTVFAQNNRFRHNTYYLGTLTSPFTWLNANRTEAQWKGYGQDTDGIFNH